MKDASYTGCTDQSGMSASMGTIGNETSMHIGPGSRSHRMGFSTPDELVIEMFKYEEGAKEDKVLTLVWTDIGIKDWKGVPKWAASLCEASGKRKEDCKTIVKDLQRGGQGWKGNLNGQTRYSDSVTKLGSAE